MQIGRATSAHLLRMGTMPKKRLISRLFLCVYTTNPYVTPKSTSFITCSVSKKALSSAVVRNKAKRRAKEAVKQAGKYLKTPIIAIVSLQAAAATVPFKDLQAELDRVFSLVS